MYSLRLLDILVAGPPRTGAPLPEGVNVLGELGETANGLDILKGCLPHLARIRGAAPEPGHARSGDRDWQGQVPVRRYRR